MFGGGRLRGPGGPRVSIFCSASSSDFVSEEQEGTPANMAPCDSLLMQWEPFFGDHFVNLEGHQRVMNTPWVLRIKHEGGLGSVSDGKLTCSTYQTL